MQLFSVQWGINDSDLFVHSAGNPSGHGCLYGDFAWSGVRRILLPLLLVPLAAARRKAKLTGICFLAILGLAIAVAATGTGCGGGGGGGGSAPVQNPTHQVTSSGVVNLTVQ
jgi:hypothetical protein